jgi:hypothetical protein
MLGSRLNKVDGIKIDQNMLRCPHRTLGCETTMVGGAEAASPATNWTGTRQSTLGVTLEQLLKVVND